MRTFFALELPAGLILQLADWRDRQLAGCGRAVPPANFHITLAFTGSLSSGALERLQLAVDSWLAGDPPRGDELLLDRIGYWSRPGIYWLGPGTWPDSLARLAGKLRQLGSAAGAPRDRNPFAPHVTLFRNCEGAPPAPARLPVFSFHYSHFTLFESRQGKSGVTYHPLRQWELAPAGG
ncbi:MAG: RNA 2',3'-cyclic phosphodiesterase [Halieaceae bacterium]|nr:RNA 2',3'-cyclic phosphodiesterase [Halieaceae bacterium]MCP5167280.1 RNA 2',3'-cyclic phosphodiesterase [Pseudomonadales bacterium]